MSITKNLLISVSLSILFFGNYEAKCSENREELVVESNKRKSDSEIDYNRTKFRRTSEGEINTSTSQEHNEENEVGLSRTNQKHDDEDNKTGLSREEKWDANAVEIGKTWNQSLEELKKDAYVFLENFRATHQDQYCPSSVTELMVHPKPSLKKIEEEIEKHNKTYPQNHIEINEFISHINFDNVEKFSVPMR